MIMQGKIMKKKDNTGFRIVGNKETWYDTDKSLVDLNKFNNYDLVEFTVTDNPESPKKNKVVFELKKLKGVEETKQDLKQPDTAERIDRSASLKYAIMYAQATGEENTIQAVKDNAKVFFHFIRNNEEWKE